MNAWNGNDAKCRGDSRGETKEGYQWRGHRYLLQYTGMQREIRIAWRFNETKDVRSMNIIDAAEDARKSQRGRGEENKGVVGARKNTEERTSPQQQRKFRANKRKVQLKKKSINPATKQRHEKRDRGPDEGRWRWGREEVKK